MHLQELKAKSPADLLAYAEELEIENASTLRKQDMMFAILKRLADNEVAIYGSGVLEVLSDSFGFGFWMCALNPELFSEPWFHVKFTLVFLLAGVHGKFSKMRRLLENDEKPLSSKSYRIWNEVPTVLMIIIVVMAVAKPI